MDLSNIHLHPNRQHPVRFRLQLRELGIQEYFSFDDAKSKKEALNSAVTRRDELLKIHRLRQSLGFKQLFSEKGLIKGLRLSVKVSKASLVLSLYNQQIGKREKFIKERVVTPENFDDAFFELLEDLIQLKGLTLDHQDKKLIKKIRMKYIRLCNELHETRIIPIKKEPSIKKYLEMPSLFSTDQKYVNGLRVTDKKKRGKSSFALRIKLGKGQVKEYVRFITKANFNSLFEEMVDLVAEHHDLTISDADQAALTKIKQRYRREFNKLEKAKG